MSSPAQSNLAWCTIDGTTVLLDIDGDRYLRLTDFQNTQFLAAAGTAARDGPNQPAGFPRPASWQPPLRRSAALDEGPFRLSDVARSLWMQRRIERRLAARSFAQVIGEARKTISQCDPNASLAEEPVRREIRAFAHARLLRTAADRCLPRSLALALRLARHGCQANVVFGVRLAPFAAHCWVQAREEVLNDELEDVLRYTPILVV